jgi:hypothetical protein
LAALSLLLVVVAFLIAARFAGGTSHLLHGLGVLLLP